MQWYGRKCHDFIAWRAYPMPEIDINAEWHWQQKASADFWTILGVLYGAVSLSPNARRGGKCIAQLKIQGEGCNSIEVIKLRLKRFIHFHLLLSEFCIQALCSIPEMYVTENTLHLQMAKLWRCISDMWAWFQWTPKYKEETQIQFGFLRKWCAVCHYGIGHLLCKGDPIA